MSVSKSYSDPFTGFIASVRDEYSLLEPKDLKWIIAELNRVRRAADKLADEKLAELEEIRQHEAHEAHIAQVTSMELPLDYNNAFSTDERAAGIIANSVDEGLILSLNTLGKVDIEFIAQICGTDCKTIIQSLRGSIYQNPDTWGECFYQGWETADEYLSGNLMRKYKTVKAANEKYNGYFNENLNAIQKVLPYPISYLSDMKHGLPVHCLIPLNVMHLPQGYLSFHRIYDIIKPSLAKGAEPLVTDHHL